MQAIIDHVARFLLAQGRRSESHAGCLYAGPGGLACGVGCLLKPGAGERLDYGSCAVVDIELDDFRPEFVSDAVRSARLDRGDPRHRFVLFLEDVQRVHDERDPDQWRDALGLLAQSWGLDAPKVDRA